MAVSLIPVTDVSAATNDIASIFPDDNLRAWVSSYVDTNHDGKLSQAEADAVTEISIGWRNISSLTGLGRFSKITYLDCRSNQITSINTTPFPLLEELYCNANQLTNLVIGSNNTAIRVINCSFNRLTSLDVSGHANLTNLNCRANNLTTLNAAKCPELQFLYCSSNRLREGMAYFNVSNSMKLLEVDISNNLFTRFDWGTKRTSMTSFDCTHNQISSMNINGLTALKELHCGENQLSDLDVSNLTGLEVLSCEYNQLSDLDVSNLTGLQELDCSDNLLTDLDVSNLTGLQELDCSDNPLADLDVSNLTGLEVLSCGNNQLTSLDVSNLTGLKCFYCCDNLLTDLDVSNLTGLEVLSCYNNQLTSLDVSNLTKLIELHCYGNALSSLDISNLPDLEELWCEDNQLTGLNISGNPSLLRAYNNSENSSDDITQYQNYLYQYDDEEVYYYGWLYCDANVEIVTTPPTPAPTEDPAGNNSGNGSSSNNPGSGSSSLPPYDPSTVSEPGVSGFVERLYTIALGRSSDPAGKSDWVAAVTERGQSGADVARGFLYSPEFLNKGLSNEDFVTVLYRTFFNREPDRDGFNAWVNALSNGASKQDVIEGFINSTEWANLCVFYGIRSGGTAVPTTNLEPNSQTIDFCTRLYTTCLNRAADQNGLMAWARQLANQRDTGSGAARGFFFSSEFIGQNVSNGEYVTRLYRTFMGREPDSDGYNAWVAQLDSGVSREDVFAGFAESPEFTRICASYGIIR